MKKALLETIKKDKQAADLLFDNKLITQATILYFKTLFAIFDYVILKKIGKAPQSHTERFIILKQELPELYQINDTYFSVYQQTYSTEIEKSICEEIQKHVNKLIAENINQEN